MSHWQVILSWLVDAILVGNIVRLWAARRARRKRAIEATLPRCGDAGWERVSFRWAGVLRDRPEQTIRHREQGEFVLRPM